jgi:tRNA(fMet)-specific endonuclease VapC
LRSHASRFEKFLILAAGLENVFITAITECELYYGAFKSSRVEKNVEVLKQLRRNVKTLYTSAEVAPLYGRIKTNLERAGRALDDAIL